MKHLLLLSFFFSGLAFAQAQPQPVGDDKVRLAVGQIIRENIRTNYPAANDAQIDKTLQRVSEVMGNAANNPQYEANATRWAWIGFRLIQRANPYISIALELCAWQGLCTPNKKLLVREVKDKDDLITQYTYEQPYPTLAIGLVYFAGKSIPAASLTCGGTDAFIENFEFYWPGLGDPCRVQAGIPSAISAHQRYLEKYGEDYFSIYPDEFDYSSYYLNTVITAVAKPAIICRKIGSGSGTLQELSQNPYWPCVTTPVPQSEIDSLLIYNGGSPIPYTWGATVKTTEGQNIKIVTDFPMTDLQLYPDAPEKGRIDLYPWLQSLTATELAPAVSPAWIQQVATAAWHQAMQSPAFDGLPLSSAGITSANSQAALDALAADWPSIADLVDPIEEGEIFVAYRQTPRLAKAYKFNWNCGFSNYPACVFNFLFDPSDSNVDSPSIVVNPFSDLSVNAPTQPNNFLTFLNSRLSGSGCYVHRASATVMGRLLIADWDFCKFAVVARDVLAIMAYVITAGFLLGSLGRN